MRWALLGCLLVVGAGATAAATGGDAAVAPEPTSQPAASDVPVTTLTATPVDSFERRRYYTGTLVAKRRSTLSFELAGKVIELAVDEGDRVSANQPLARLDTRRLSAQRAQAQAELAAAKARLAELDEGPRKQTIAAAEAEVRSLAAQRDVAKLRLERRERLVQRGAISREEYDDALFEFRVATARTDVGQKTLDELLAGTRIEQIEAQRAQVESIEARLADINHRLDDAVMLAPFAGRIVRRRLDEGTVIAAGAPVFELIEDNALEAWVGVPPASARSLRVGNAIEVTIDNRPRQAVIKSVRPELDPETRTQNVVLMLGDASDLVAGRIVRLGVGEPVATRGFWLPTASLTPDRRGLWSVLVVGEGGRVAARPVEVLENDGDRSFVRGALQAGEEVIVEGVHRVVPGQQVSAR